MRATVAGLTLLATLGLSSGTAHAAERTGETTACATLHEMSLIRYNEVRSDV